MGLPTGISKDRTNTPGPVPTGNPDPKNFTIKRIVSAGKYSALEVNYPNCTNYEGNKILVVWGDENLMRRLNRLDPHFSDSDESYWELIARFQPTEKGWMMACWLTVELNKMEQ